MPSRNSVITRRGSLEENPLGKRLAEEVEHSGIKRVKYNVSQLGADSDDTGNCIVVSPRTTINRHERGIEARGAESPPCAPTSPSLAESTDSVLHSNTEAIDKIRPERGDEKISRNVYSMKSDSANSEHHHNDRLAPIENRSSSPSLHPSRLPSEEINSPQVPTSIQYHKKPSLLGSEYSMSTQSEEPRSPDLTTPTSGPETPSIENNSVALSPRSRTTSLVPLQLQSSEARYLSSSSVEQTQRTPLPTKKESTLQRHGLSSGMEMDQDTGKSPSPSPTSRSPRGASLDPQSNRNQSESDARRLSTESVGMHNDQRKSSSNDGISSRNRSPSETPSSEMITTGLSTRSRARASPSVILGEEVIGTPPKKRSTLEDSIPGNRNKAAKSGPYTTFSSNFNVMTSESVEKSQGVGSKPTKPRGRKPSGSTSAERGHSNEKSSVTHSPQRKMDLEQQTIAIKHDGLSRQVQPMDHTPRVVFEIPDSPQPPARPPPTNQTSVPSHHSRTLPPRPSTTPPPAAASQILHKYRPPAVVFTIDNRAESRLLASDVQTYIEEFTKHTRILTPPPRPGAPSGIFPVGVIMWQNMPDFYKWYAETTGLAEIGPLRLELLDVHWQPEKAFVVPEGNLNYFRTLKQHVWDLFWVGSQVNGSPSLFRILIAPLRSVGETISSTPTTWNPVNPKDAQGRISGAANLENIMVVAEPRQFLPSTMSPPQPASRQPGVSTLPSMTSNIGHMLNTREEGESKRQGGKRSNTSPQADQASKSVSQNAGGSSRPHPSHYIHGPPGPPVNAARTSWDKVMLRDRAHAFLVGREDVELLSEESTVHDKLPYNTGSQVCGGIIDRNSGKGLVTITGKGFITQNIPTGPDETGNRYQEVSIQPKQTCMLHGNAVVLYYKRRNLGSPSLQPAPLQAKHQTSLSASSAMSSPAISTSPVEIVLRLQMDGAGKFSASFDKSVIRPKVNTTEFFAWFSTQTRRGDSQGPPCLKFTFKDAMPVPKATEVSRGNEDHFDYMRKDIKAQCERAKAYMPDMKEFVVLVTVPGWESPKGEEEEEW